ncbi:hypothetical protein [Roseiarcus sp.]|uniref:hypothetical protein n=1 Tax=Roseiarcus sp. TaxID=1969460 RepID=UPI003F9D8994
MSIPLAGIRLTLQRMRAEIRSEQAKAIVAAKSKRPGDPQLAEFWRRLEKYEADLRRVQRDLSSRLHSLEHQRTQLWNVPRDLRYSARQSIDDREAVTQALVDEAAAILRDLINFCGDVAVMKPADWESLFEDLTKFGDKVDHAFFHTVVQQVQKGPAIGAPAPLMFSLANFAPMIGLIAAIISARLRKRV